MPETAQPGTTSGERRRAATGSSAHVRLWDPSSQLRFAKNTTVPPRPDGAGNHWPAEEEAA